jgi:ribosomal protein L11 methyltransferase
MIQLKVPISTGHAQQLEEYFCEEGSDHWMIESIPGGRDYHLYGFYHTADEVLHAYNQLCNLFTDLPSTPVISELPDQDWQEAYKLHFQPWQCGNLHWVPVWLKEEYTVPEGDQALYLDPGMAFGTGNHETTRLCVEALLDYRSKLYPEEIATKRVIDAGCGSGILSLSAALLGFQNIFAFDIDEDSIRISRENAALNDLSSSVHFTTDGVSEAIKPKSVNLILANILAPILIQNSSILLSGLMPSQGSSLVLSGVLKEETKQVQEAFQDSANQLSLNLEIRIRNDGIWSALDCYIL